MTDTQTLARAMASEADRLDVDLLEVATMAATLADRRHVDPRAMLADEVATRYAVPVVTDPGAWGRVAALLTLWAERGIVPAPAKPSVRPTYRKVYPDGSTTLIGGMVNSWNPPGANKGGA